MYVCIYIYINIHTHIHTRTDTASYCIRCKFRLGPVSSYD